MVNTTLIVTKKKKENICFFALFKYILFLLNGNRYLVTMEFKIVTKRNSAVSLYV